MLCASGGAKLMEAKTFTPQEPTGRSMPAAPLDSRMMDPFGSSAWQARPVALLTRIATERRYARAAAFVVFMLAASAAFHAQQTSRPVTAAIVFLLGVTLVGA